MTDVRLQEELRKYEARTAECEDLIRILDDALSLVPVTAISQGYTWMPSEDALRILSVAKDRIAEFKRRNYD